MPLGFSYAAVRTGTLQNIDDATKQSNWYDEKHGGKGLGQLERDNSSLVKEYAANGGYKGASNYQTFIHKNPNTPSKQVGPMKASTNIRTITVTDYSPDVCKDYKQTGFCGFGDSCKFLHAREDYKQGWQLDREWESVTKGKKLGSGQVTSSRNQEPSAEGLDDEALLEGIPFACIICKEPYKNPIVTKCGHYFCEACALRRFKKTPACAACGSGTGGVFNVAKSLNALLQRKQARATAHEHEERSESA